MSDIFPNQRLQDLYNSYNQLLNFSGLCWWLIDVKDDPNVYYCNKVMCQTFSLDETVIKHSVAQTCPIAGDFNKNIAIRSSEKATKIFEDYSFMAAKSSALLSMVMQNKLHYWHKRSERMFLTKQYTIPHLQISLLPLALVTVLFCQMRLIMRKV